MWHNGELVQKEIEVSDADLRTEYDTNKAQYEISEQRDIEQIVFPDKAAADAAAFRNAHRRRALLNKLRVICRRIEAGDVESLCAALRKLRNDVLKKTDGEGRPIPALKPLAGHQFEGTIEGRNVLWTQALDGIRDPGAGGLRVLHRAIVFDDRWILRLEEAETAVHDVDLLLLRYEDGETKVRSEFEGLTLVLTDGERRAAHTLRGVRLELKDVGQRMRGVRRFDAIQQRDFPRSALLTTVRIHRAT